MAGGEGWFTDSSWLPGQALQGSTADQNWSPNPSQGRIIFAAAQPGSLEMQSGYASPLRPQC